MNTTWLGRISMAWLAAACVACGDDLGPEADPPDGDRPSMPAPGGKGLTRVDAEPAGARCASGGLVLRSGLDDDGDGQLDGSEIDDEQVICDDEIWKGHFGAEQWNDPAAVAAMRKARVIEGSLGLIGDAPVELPALALVTGDISVDRKVPAVRLPLLWMVGGSVSLRERAVIGRLELPVLRTIGGYLDLGGTSHMEELRLPALTSVGGSLRYWYSANIDHLALPELATIGGDLSLGPSSFDCPRLTHVTGHVSVHGATRNLDGLRALSSVRGDLLIGSARSLERAELPALASVGGRLAFRVGAELPALERFSAPRLVAVGAGVEMGYAPAIASLDLGALARPGGSVELNNLPKLRTLALGMVSMHVDAKPTTFTVRNTAIVSLDLPLTEVNGPITIASNPQLETLRLDSLKGGTLSIQHNQALRDVSLAAATTLSLDVSQSPALTRLSAPAVTRAPALTLAWVGLADLSGLPALRDVGRLTLNSLPLTSLAELSWLTIATDLHLVGLDKLTSLAGLDNLTRIRATLEIGHNAALADLRALSKLAEIRDDVSGGGLVIRRNPRLVHLHGLESLADISGALRIEDNDALVDLAGLGGLRHLDGTLYLSDNDALATVDGPTSLLGIGSYMMIMNNAALTTLKGLAGLRSVGRGVWIGENPQLAHLDLAGLTYIARTLDVVGNERLPAAEVDELRARTGNPGHDR